MSEDPYALLVIDMQLVAFDGKVIAPITNGLELLDSVSLLINVCRSHEIHIARKTEYKILSRYHDCGVQGLTDRSRRPYRHANLLPFQIEKRIIKLKKEYPHWGAPKIRERLSRLYPQLTCPAVSTVHAVLDRNGLIKRRKRRRHRATGCLCKSHQSQRPLVC